MSDRYQWRRDRNAIKYMYNKIYNLDKDFSFKFPQYRKDLQPYAIRMRSIIEEALEIAGVVPVVGHELEYPSQTKKSEDEEK